MSPIAKIYLEPSTYYWRVKMIDADRNEGTYSNSYISVTCG